MNIALWIVQFLLAVQFLWHGYFMIAPPPNLPETARWVYDLAPALRIFIGVAELLAAAGLILPGLTRIRTGLTPLAALGLALIMILAIVFHLQRGEGFVINVVVLVLSSFVAYGRWRVKPLPGREESRGRAVRPLA